MGENGEHTLQRRSDNQAAIAKTVGEGRCCSGGRERQDVVDP